MHVALLAATDAPQYRRLMLQAYEWAADAFTSTPEERAAEPASWWIARIADPAGKSVAYGAFDEGRLIGSVALEFSARPKTRHKALLIGMYVDPASRRAGAGRALVRAAIDHCRQRGDILAMTLTVTEGNDAAIELYRSMGFSTFGTEPMAILTPAGFRAKVHMWRRIETGSAPDEELDT